MHEIIADTSDHNNTNGFEATKRFKQSASTFQHQAQQQQHQQQPCMEVEVAD